MDQELGITYKRLFELAEIRIERRREDMYDYGRVAALAQHDPEQLNALEPKGSKEIDMDKIPAMMRPVPPTE